ncbi:GNAT family N-acetyltransferase [Vibrio sp. S4M6]|uniref:GNAT family N-acetyltransferase n=1 Tax=Vibrio sinus TaxID=2946865 RepID=UPI002029D524|nr:GNAT family N-acetyltransferase [Vibrio sinus]MCL9783808.1 GNAT family N-acetyltransferase [Vibrio sinus]
MISENSIRNFSPDDIDNFFTAFKNIVNEDIYYINTTPPSLEMVRSWCERNIEKNMIHVIMSNDCQLAGSCDIYQREHEGAPHIGVLAIFVVKEFRGNGIATKLMQEVLIRAKSRGIEKIELEVLANNHGAIHCYKKFGFFQEGKRQNAKKLKDGSYVDALLMAKFL